MKVRATRAAFQSALQTVCGAISSTNSIAALSHVLIKANDSGIEFNATDLELLLQTKVEAEVKEAGNCLLPAQKFQNLVQTLPSPDTVVELNLKNNRMEVLVDETNSNFKLPVLSENDFPDMKEKHLQSDSPEIISFSMETELLHRMLKNTQFAASTDASRSYLGGVLFDFNQESLKVVATDTHRLALYQTTDYKLGSGSSEYIKPVLLPLKPVKELIKILPDEGIVEIKTDGKMAMVSFDDTFMITRLIDDDFPSYEQVIPDEADFQNRINLDRQRLLNCVNRVTLLADDRTKKLLLEFGHSELAVMVEDSEEGMGVEKISIENPGDEMTIAFNGDYLAEILKYIEDDQICLDLISSDNSGTFRPVEAGNYLYLVMPMRLS